MSMLRPVLYELLRPVLYKYMPVVFVNVKACII
jgi:hypothetical protein